MECTNWSQNTYYNVGLGAGGAWGDKGDKGATN